MTNLLNIILDKYSIDISKENILMLYNIDTPNISEHELERVLIKTKESWRQSLDKVAENDAETYLTRLDNAEKYEAILKDKELRNELFTYYSSKSVIDGSSNEGESDFAKSFFQLVAKTKKLKREDVDFFFEYFTKEQRNKNAIINMLSREYVIAGLGKEYHNKDTKKVDKKSKNNNSLIVNFFQKDTLLTLRDVFDSYEIAKGNQEIQQKYPNVLKGLYGFLDIQNVDNIDTFIKVISEKINELELIPQHDREGVAPLAVVYKNLLILTENKDVIDNFGEFILLIRYPVLTPYMYVFGGMKASALHELYLLANEANYFSDKIDFLINYYIPICDNFGISNNGISSLIKKAKKSVKANGVQIATAERGTQNKKYNLPMGAEIMCRIAYLPIWLVYWVLEAFHMLITRLYILALPIFILIVVAENRLFPRQFGSNSLMNLLKVFNKSQWNDILASFINEPIMNTFETVIISIIYILCMLMLYILPAMFVAGFIIVYAMIMEDKHDWIGYKRTFQETFQDIKDKSEKQFLENEKKYYRIYLTKIVTNVICALVLLGILVFLL